MAKLNNTWYDAFDGSFDEEEDVIEFIFDNIDTSSFEDSYIDVVGHREPCEMFKQTKQDKVDLLYGFMMSLIKNNII